MPYLRKEEESETVRNAPDEAQRVPVEYSRYMLELSGVAETLVKALTLLQSPLVINLIFQVAIPILGGSPVPHTPTLHE